MRIDKNSQISWGIMLLVSVILSFVIRIPNLYYTSYWWRAVQTEMSTYWLVKEGIDLFNYQTPLYGPPWQIPLEFPLFQATAAIMVKTGLVENVSFACRLTAMMYFYLSALFLYLIGREIFSDNRTNLAVVTIYLWLPYNIYYSLEPLIDYLALALALAYLYFTLLWIKSGLSTRYALLGIIFGSLSMLVKPTTTPIVAIPITAFVFMDVMSKYNHSFTHPYSFRFMLGKILARWSYWLLLGLLAIVPLLVGAFWTRHSDYIKESSIFTQWLTSSALVPWNFGTWEIRSNPYIWIAYSLAIQRFLLPYGLLFFGILGLYIAAKETIIFWNGNEKINLFVVSTGVSALIVFVVFLNLYRHEYYYISLSASMSIMAGYGIMRFLRSIQKPRSFLGLIFMLWMVIFVIFNIKDHDRFQDIVVSESRQMQKSLVWAREVQKYVLDDEWVISVQYAWDPVYVYPLERKAMVIGPRELEMPICSMLSDRHFSLVVVGDLNYSQNDILLSKVFGCFSSSVEVMPGVYQVQH